MKYKNINYVFRMKGAVQAVQNILNVQDGYQNVVVHRSLDKRKGQFSIR